VQVRRIDRPRRVTDLKEAQLRTLAQVGKVLTGTHLLERQPAAAEAGCYAHFETVPKRFGY